MKLTVFSLTGFFLALGGCTTSTIESEGASGGNSNGAGGQGGAIINLSSQPDPKNPSGGAGGVGGDPSTEGCTEGVDCVCPAFNVAVIGKPGKWGVVQGGDSDTALQEWLTSNSAGTAKVDVVTQRTKLTPELLATYNVIILASQSEDSDQGPFWTYDDAEIAAFRDWVEQGGGVITLTGYSSNSAEINPINQLIGFSGVTYSPDKGTWGSCQADQVICDCCSSFPIVDWNRSDAVIANLSNNIKLIGWVNGRHINPGSNGHVAATWPGPINAVVAALAGKGRVLAFGDEWITYTSQWTGEKLNKDTRCVGHQPQDAYQTAQFWYNMIHWSSPGATCFKIVNKDQPVQIW